MAKIVEKDKIIAEITGDDIPEDSLGWESIQMIMEFLHQSKRYDLVNCSVFACPTEYTKVTLEFRVEHIAGAES